MERFARAVVAGGVALVAGLWVLELAEGLSAPWLGGLALAVAGAVALGAGVASEIAY